jgi:hypothetical protein
MTTTMARGTPPSSPAKVAAAAVAAYAVLLGALWHLHGIQGFIHVGSSFVTRSDRSTVITPALRVDNRVGYDGQFYFYVAADPANARYYLGRKAGFVYPRIVYPMLARAVALGRPAAVPYALVAINLAAVGAAVLALALWLRRRSTSTWLALLYAVFPGVAFCVYRDLTEPLAFAFALIGVVVLDSRRRHALTGAALLFSLAALTRETTVVFPAVYALSLLVGREGRWRARVRANAHRVALFSAIAFLPLLAERIAFRLWLGTSTVESGSSSAWPFAGLASWWPFNTMRWFVVLAVVVPALAWGGSALFALRQRFRSPELWLVVVNVLVFVVFLPGPVFIDYGSAGRASTGAVAAAVFSYPTLRELWKPNRPLALLPLAWSPLSYAAAIFILALTGA